MEWKNTQQNSWFLVSLLITKLNTAPCVRTKTCSGISVPSKIWPEDSELSSLLVHKLENLKSHRPTHILSCRGDHHVVANLGFFLFQVRCVRRVLVSFLYSTSWCASPNSNVTSQHEILFLTGICERSVRQFARQTEEKLLHLPGNCGHQLSKTGHSAKQVD